MAKATSGAIERLLRAGNIIIIIIAQKIMGNIQNRRKKSDEEWSI